MKNFPRLTLLLLLLIALSAGAQRTLNYSFRHLGQSNGFPAEYVRAIEFDTLGQLWALTEKGLMCYNGHSGKFYGGTGDLKGLLPGTAYNLYFDAKHILWISYLESAVSCFDPATEKFTHFIHDPSDESSFPNATTSQFFEDSDGNFWIGTWGGGLNLLDRISGKFVRYLPIENNPASLQSTYVTNVTEMSSGLLIISTWEGDGNENFLSFFDVREKTFSKFPIDSYSCESEIESIKVRAALRIVHFVEIDQDQNWWVGTYTGVFYINHKTKTIVRKTGLDKNLLESRGHITFDNVLDILFETEDVIWFRTEADGILVYDKKKDEVGYVRKSMENQSSISGNIIRDFEKDRFGNIWVATKSGGLDVYCPSEGQVKIISNAYLQADKMHYAQGQFAINCMIVSNMNPNIIVGHGNGASLYNTETGEVTRIEIRQYFLEALKRNPALEKHNHNNPNFVGVVHEILGGYILGTYCGTVKYTIATGQVDFSTMDLLEGFYPAPCHGEKEILLLGSKRNKVDLDHTDLISYIGKLNTTTLLDEPLLYLPTDIRTGEEDNYVVFEEIDSTNYYLRFNENSFLIYNSVDNTFDTYSFLPPYQNFPDSTIRLLHIDNFGIVWLRTTNGIYAFDYKTKEIFDIQQNLDLNQDDVVRCLARDQQGILWIALNADLIRYNPSTKESFRFNRRHGFDAGGFSDRFIRKHNLEEVVIPANYGLLMFDPKRIVYHTSSPEMYISEIVIGKDTLSQDRETDFTRQRQILKHHENFITIEFAADLLYATSGKTYEYRLIGLDSSWIRTTGQNKVSYTNLGSGEYEFQVRCIDGYMNTSNTLSLKFFIDKAFWLKWWFILLEIVVGLALIFIYIKWREKNLRDAKVQLEMAVEVRTHEVTEKVIEIEHQKEIIEVKNKELTDSINYAKGIQNSLLAHKGLLDANLPEYAILYKPKDIVSGDFYWAAKVNSAFYLGVCDSTGHGVPGAFMSLLNIRYLYEAVVEKKIDAPNIALDYVRMRLIENLAVDGAKDGMDGTLIKFDADRRKIVYASAQNRPVLIRNGSVINLPADKMPIGAGYTLAPFQPNQIDLQPDDVLYFFTDGYQDQFGGPKGRKLKNVNLVQFLKSIHHLPMKEQLPLMEQHLAHWRGDLEQLDDILLFGIRIK